jgi:hypothetical protein
MPIGNEGFGDSRPYALGKVLAGNAFERRIGIEHAHHKAIVAAENVGSVYTFLDVKCLREDRRIGRKGPDTSRDILRAALGRISSHAVHAAEDFAVQSDRRRRLYRGSTKIERRGNI